MDNSPIRVALVSHFSHLRMGGQKSMLALIENLDKSKFDIFCIVPRDGELSAELSKMGCNVVLIPLSSLKPKNFFRITANFFRILHFLRSNKIDIIHTDHERDTFLCGLAKIFTKTKMIWHVRLTRKERLDRINAALADGIIGISRGTMKRFKKIRFIDLKFRVIFNGVDRNLFYPAASKKKLRRKIGIGTERRIVLFVGQLKDSKGIEDLINSIPILQEISISKPLLLLIGAFKSDDFKQRILRVIRENVSENDIIIKEHQENIHQWMAASDVLVLPSYEGSEGMGRVLFEAMACGLPVVGTNISGINEAVAPDSGFLVNEHSPRQIAGAVRTILDNRDLYESFSLFAYKRAGNVFDIKIHTELVEKFYIDILNNGIYPTH